MALNLEEAEAMVKTAYAKGVSLKVELMFHYSN
jgi:predicted dehydrogenase